MHYLVAMISHYDNNIIDAINHLVIDGLMDDESVIMYEQQDQ